MHLPTDTEPLCGHNGIMKEILTLNCNVRYDNTKSILTNQ